MSYERRPAVLPRTFGCQRDLFDLPTDIAYFDCASVAPLMKSAQEAGHEALRKRAKPGRFGVDDLFEGVEQRRCLFAGLIGSDSDGIALVPSSSYGMATAAKNLTAREDQRVIVIDGDYPSNIYTWRTFSRWHGCEVHAVRRAPGGTWTDAVLAAIDERTAIVAVPNVHWTDGSLLDLAAIGAAARAHNARLVIDASQSAGALPLALDAICPDFLVTVGYKWLLGPFGLGYLYVAPEHRDGSPLEENWMARASAGHRAHLTDYTDAYQGGARRFDVGERSFFEVTPVANAALRQLAAWTVDSIAATLAAITGRIEAGARALGIGVEDAARRGPHMLGLKLPAAARIAADKHFEKAGVSVGFRPGAMRVSPHVYTTDEDIERLLAALGALVG